MRKPPKNVPLGLITITAEHAPEDVLTECRRAVLSLLATHYPQAESANVMLGLRPNERGYHLPVLGFGPPVAVVGTVSRGDVLGDVVRSVRGLLHFFAEEPYATVHVSVSIRDPHVIIPVYRVETAEG